MFLPCKVYGEEDGHDSDHEEDVEAGVTERIACALVGGVAVRGIYLFDHDTAK